MNILTQPYKALSILVCLILFSCDGYNNSGSTCDDVGSYVTSVNIADMELKLLTQPEQHLLPADITQQYKPTESIVFDSLILSLYTELSYLYSSQPKTPPPYQLSLFSKAYACSIAPAMLQDQIIDISITSSNAFNAENPAGSLLTPFFDVVYSDSHTEYYDFSNDTLNYLSVEDYMEQENVKVGKIMQFRLNTQPEFLNNQKFTISISLDSGQMFTLETPEITFEQQEN